MNDSVALQGLLIFGWTLLIGKWMIPYLKRMKAGQSIREDGPQSHLKKSGTPTIGGLIFIIPITLAYLFMGDRSDSGLKVLITGFLIFALIGLADDYLKVVKKRNLGLRAYQKLSLQFLGAVVVIGWLYQAGMVDSGVMIHTLDLNLDIGWLKIPFLMVFILATVNSVNLTDGLDGLAAGITFVISVLFFFYAQFSGMAELGRVIFFFIAGMAGFLMFNKRPAKVFMGDTGSLALGGYVSIAAILLRIEILLLLYGFIYFAESVSVILQVASFKARGKRIFRMSPIHHHFELGGWPEQKVVGIFMAVTVLTCMISWWILSKGAVL